MTRPLLLSTLAALLLSLAQTVAAADLLAGTVTSM